MGVNRIGKELPSEIGVTSQEVVENLNKSTGQYIRKENRLKNYTQIDRGFCPNATALPSLPAEDTADEELDARGPTLSPAVASPLDIARQNDRETGGNCASFSESSLRLEREQKRAVLAAFGIEYSVPAQPAYLDAVAILRQRLRRERRTTSQTPNEELPAIWAGLADQLESS